MVPDETSDLPTTLPEASFLNPNRKVPSEARSLRGLFPVPVFAEFPSYSLSKNADGFLQNPFWLSYCNLRKLKPFPVFSGEADGNGIPSGSGRHSGKAELYPSYCRTALWIQNFPVCGIRLYKNFGFRSILVKSISQSHHFCIHQPISKRAGYKARLHSTASARVLNACDDSDPSCVRAHAHSFLPDSPNSVRPDFRKGRGSCPGFPSWSFPVLPPG